MTGAVGAAVAVASIPRPAPRLVSAAWMALVYLEEHHASRLECERLACGYVPCPEAREELARIRADCSELEAALIGAG